ncbi:MAG: acyl-CoA desaturase [Solirubrobacterales bacterium]|nr:acyl-CoA desaturase [Solirubrobacterales bacterium]
MSEAQLEELANEFDTIHDEVYADLGERDRQYIQSMIEMHRRLAVLSRVLLLAAPNRGAWIAGTAAGSAAKILENMEIGHNVLHGQWDWMNDPQIHSTTWDWDTASTSEAWKHSHNYVHHTYTNIRGKDKDLGYEIMRIDPDQKWHPVYLGQPIYNLLLMAFFEWGVALHDLDLDAIRKGEKPMDEVRHELKGIAGKAKSQVVKDYIAWPAVSAAANVAGSLAISAVTGKLKKKQRSKAIADAAEAGRKAFKSTATANFTSNIVRNFWSNAIIFCGHFPDQTYVFSQEEVVDESRGAWYVRQLAGAANIDGNPMFHIASGNLSFQVEHHLFPDMPSSRYAEIAPRVKDVCERYGLPYNTGPFFQQWSMVQKTILRLAFPGGEHKPKPGPYVPEKA